MCQPKGKLTTTQSSAQQYDGTIKKKCKEKKKVINCIYYLHYYYNIIILLRWLLLLLLLLLVLFIIIIIIIFFLIIIINIIIFINWIMHTHNTQQTFIILWTFQNYLVFPTNIPQKYQIRRSNIISELASLLCSCISFNTLGRYFQQMTSRERVVLCHYWLKQPFGLSPWYILQTWLRRLDGSDIGCPFTTTHGVPIFDAPSLIVSLAFSWSTSSPSLFDTHRFKVWTSTSDSFEHIASALCSALFTPSNISKNLRIWRGSALQHNLQRFASTRRHHAGTKWDREALIVGAVILTLLYQQSIPFSLSKYGVSHTL